MEGFNLGGSLAFIGNNKEGFENTQMPCDEEEYGCQSKHVQEYNNVDLC